MAEAVRCPACGFEMAVTRDLAGMTMECPKCGAPFEIPGEPLEAVAGEALSEMTPPASGAAGDKRPRTAAKAARRPAWDLPETAVPDLHPAMRDEKSRQFRIAVAVGIAVMVAVVSLLLANRLKKGGPQPGPGVDMIRMNQDVEVDRLRFRVTAAAWRQERTGAATGVSQRVLDVHMTVTNLDNSPRTMPLVMLGDRWGKSLAADFGTPVFSAEDGKPVGRLKPGETVRGHVVFQPRLDEYSLIIRCGDSGDRGAVRVRLTATALPAGK